MNSLLLLLLYGAFPVVCIFAIPQDSRSGGLAERVVLGVALYQFLLLSIGLALGLTSHLTAPMLALAIGGATLFLGVQGVRNGLPPLRAQTRRWLRTRRGGTVFLLLGLVVSTFALELSFDLSYGTRHGDGLWYHIPRVIFWAGQGNFAPWPTPVAASLGLPVGADLILLHKILLGEGWGGAGYATLVLSLGAIACIYLAGLEFGLKRWHAIMAALLFASFPAVGLRIWSVNSDIAAAFPALAAFVVLHRLRNVKIGLALFIILNGMAIACKPTVAPPAMFLALLALWRCRQRLLPLRAMALPAAAALLGAATLVIASYWPVYAIFGDFLGGGYSRVHRTATVTEFFHAVAMHTGFWLLEPFGYLTRFRSGWESEAIRSFYNALGAHFDTLPEMWKPYPGQDSGYTGLAALLALPILFAGLRPPGRKVAVVLFLLGYLPLCGMISPQPYFTRYNLLLLAGVALLWGGTRFFARGARRWLLVAIVSVNLCALLGVVVINIHLQRTHWSQPGGLYYYVSDVDRATMAASLAGRPLQVLTEASMRIASLDALLTGPGIAFPLRYVICPADGDWAGEFRLAASRSGWLALVHNGQRTMIPGPEFELPGSHTCSELPLPELEDTLTRSGWVRYRQNKYVDLWRHQ